MTWRTLLGEMGWMALAVVGVLAAMSLTAVALTVSKWWRLRKMARATRQFSPRFSEAVEQGRITAALELCRQHADSHMAKVLGAALQRVAPLLADRRRRHRAAEIAERALEREQILLAAELRSGLGGIATIGATAPFVGLLGTVIGITNSFTGLAEAGGGGIEAIAGGIGETLVTTAIGLLVAIPSVWVYNHFMTRLERLFSELTYAGQELVDWIEVGEGGPEDAAVGSVPAIGSAPGKVMSVSRMPENGRNVAALARGER